MFVNTVHLAEVGVKTTHLQSQISREDVPGQVSFLQLEFSCFESNEELGAAVDEMLERVGFGVSNGR